MKRSIMKWFDRLSFPAQWRQDVRAAAEDFRLDQEHSPMWHLLYALSRCDALEKQYHSRGILEEILLATLSDLVIWAENHDLVHGTVGLLEPWWLEGHLNFELFRLGRIQFKMGTCSMDIPPYGLHRGKQIVEIHIPQGEPLNMDEVHKSYHMAKTFFKTYFPEYQYKYFICDSWLLDWHLKDFLKETSNILKFAAEFDIVHYKPSNDAVRRLFELNPHKGPENTFQKNIRTFVENGGQLLEGYGILTWDGLQNDL